MCPAKVADGAERGWIIPIGGAEEKTDGPEILSRFVELCGGKNADIVVIPTASRLRDTGSKYQRLFKKLGAARVYDDVRMAVKCDPDSIYIDAMEGGTGAGPHIATEDTGIPGIAGSVCAKVRRVASRRSRMSGVIRPKR